MKRTICFLLIICNLCSLTTIAQTSSLKVVATVSNEISNNLHQKGRIFLFVSESNNREPRMNTWPNKSNMIFATNIDNWEAGKSFTFDNSVPFVKSVDLSLDKIQNGKYKIQVLWDQNTTESSINAPEIYTVKQ
ncbi:MAG: hypothetical protein IPF54_24990 [Draconibacterium sp.]|nr:hypothetical protein [Draconibacterium sp.]